MILHIWRRASSPTGTLGEIDLDGQVVGYSLELPWAYNKRGKSCILPGAYKATVEQHSRWPVVIRLSGVRGRSGILMHPGNGIGDTQGCILAGQILGTWQQYEQLPTLVRSRSTINAIVSKLGGVGARLDVHVHGVSEYVGLP